MPPSLSLADEAGLRTVIKLALRGHAIRANSSSIALC
jgi:hypothetical protein